MPGKPLGSQAQQLVLNLTAYFEREKENGGPVMSIDRVHERVAQALNISSRTVYTIKHRSVQNPVLSSPGKNRSCRKPKTKDLPEATKMEVRNTVYDMYKEKKHLTLKTLRNVLATKEFIHTSTTSLAILLKDIGFKYKKECNRRALTEKLNIVCMRNVFLREYMNNLNSTLRQVVFLDETWIFSKGNRMKSWQNDNIKSVRKPEGYDGKRFIIIHAGTENGFIKGASLIFPSKAITGDYHGEMNGDSFKQWVNHQLIPNLEVPSLIIMDNAPYHSAIQNKQPNTSSKKTEIMEWLRKKDISYSPAMSKNELIQLVKYHKEDKIFIIDEIIRESGHEVLRLPPYHCDFNAIEMIWAKVKNYYNSNIGRNGYSDERVKEMWNEALQQCNENTWYNCVRHTENLIKKWHERKQFLDRAEIAPIIINVNDSSSESESETD